MARKNSVVSMEEVKWLISEDQDFLKSMIQQAVQEVLEAEMNEALQVAKNERSENLLGYRSGSYGRSLFTRAGKIELRVPQDRHGRFSTEVFERYQRSEKALVSAMVKKLDDHLKEFSERDLEEEFPYMLLDARYEKVREGGAVRSRAVQIAIGVDSLGRRQVLGVEIANRNG